MYHKNWIDGTWSPPTSRDLKKVHIGEQIRNLIEPGNGENEKVRRSASSIYQYWFISCLVEQEKTNK